jgi:hypothetical protein
MKGSVALRDAPFGPRRHRVFSGGDGQKTTSRVAGILDAGEEVKAIHIRSHQRHLVCDERPPPCEGLARDWVLAAVNKRKSVLRACPAYISLGVFRTCHTLARRALTKNLSHTTSAIQIQNAPGKSSAAITKSLHCTAISNTTTTLLHAFPRLDSAVHVASRLLFFNIRASSRSRSVHYCRHRPAPRTY